MKDLQAISNGGGQSLDTFGVHKENNKKPKVETVVIKNNPRNIQQLYQEEEDSSLTIVDLPVSERLLDSNMENIQ